MVDYCTEANIEAYMLEDFDANSRPTTTQIGTLITRASRMADGASGLADDGLGASPPSNIVQGTIEVCAMLIDNFREKDTEKRHTSERILEVLELWLNRSGDNVWAYTTTTSRNQNNDYLGPARPTRTS